MKKFLAFSAVGLLWIAFGFALGGMFSSILMAEGVSPSTSVVATSHNVLSTSHPDTTPAAATRGDIITAQGASPLWARLAKGAQYIPLTMGANEPGWTALALDQTASTSGALPVSRGGTGVANGFALDRTVTTTGTTGAQTINKSAGTVNVAAAAGSIVVTNSTVTTSSIVFTVLRTADGTCTFVKSVVPTANTITITLNANCTAETSVGFLVTN